MEATNAQGVVQTDSTREVESQKKRLRENCKEFESVMISYMMKSMRDSIMRGDEEGNAMGMYEDMLAGQVSKEISHTSALGIGDLLYAKLEPLVKVKGPKEGGLSAVIPQTDISQPQAKNPGVD